MATNKSKFLSLVLRHRPEAIGLTLDPAGWADADELCSKAGLSRAELEQIVARCPKKRFALEGDRVRANQGHSVEVELGHEPAAPPAVLYHGTHAAAAAAILKDGIKKMARHHVHLSADVATAETVGSRRGRPVVLTVDAGRMAADGRGFFVTPNGVRLTGAVPPEYVRVRGGREVPVRRRP